MPDDHKSAITEAAIKAAERAAALDAGVPAARCELIIYRSAGSRRGIRRLRVRLSQGAAECRAVDVDLLAPRRVRRVRTIVEYRAPVGESAVGAASAPAASPGPLSAVSRVKVAKTEILHQKGKHSFSLDPMILPESERLF